jgi:transcriptional regulator with XRE-family HTH domain
MSTLGENLRKARERMGWSQTFVCQKLGISNSTLSGYERGYREPDADMISTFAEIYHVSADYLLGRTKQSAQPSAEQPHTSDQSSTEEQIKQLMDDPETGIFFKDYLQAPEEKRKQLRDFMRFLLEQEKERKAGDKQGES